MPQMRTDEGHGRRRRAWRTDEEHGQWMMEEDGNASMDIVRVVAGVFDSRDKAAVSLSASVYMDNESCAGGWESVIDIGGAMSIIVDGYIMFFSRIEE